MLQVRNNIKRRKRKEVNGLKPGVGISLYSESEQGDGFGSQELLVFGYSESWHGNLEKKFKERAHRTNF